MLCYQQTYLHSYAAWIALPLLGGTSLANDPVDYPCQDRPRGVKNHWSWQPSWLFLLPNLPWSGVWSESGFRTLCDSVVGVLGDSSFLEACWSLGDRLTCAPWVRVAWFLLASTFLLSDPPCEPLLGIELWDASDWRASRWVKTKH